MNTSPSTTTEQNTWSRGALIHVHQCPACGSPEIRQTFVRRDDQLAMPDAWRMVQCAACQSIYLAARPDAASLPLAYGDYYTHESGHEKLAAEEQLGVIDRLVNGYLHARFNMQHRARLAAGSGLFRLVPPLAQKLDRYGRHIPRALCQAPSRLLDIGCGNGDFLKLAHEMGITQACGFEPDAKAVAACQAEKLNVHHGDAFASELNHQQFDYITLNHVLEHVEDPRGLLARVFSLTAPQGYIWLALPNPQALGVDVYKAGWNGLHPPFHLLIPAQKILLQWLHEAGFSDIKLLPRGAQSPSQWRESRKIAAREHITPSPIRIAWTRLLGDISSTFTGRWSEETVIMARKLP